MAFGGSLAATQHTADNCVNQISIAVNSLWTGYLAYDAYTTNQDPLNFVTIAVEVTKLGTSVSTAASVCGVPTTAASTKAAVVPAHTVEFTT